MHRWLWALLAACSGPTPPEVPAPADPAPKAPEPVAEAPPAPTSESPAPDADVRLVLTDLVGARAHTLIAGERLDFAASHLIELDDGLLVIDPPPDPAAAETFRLYTQKLNKPVIWTTSAGAPRPPGVEAIELSLGDGKTHTALWMPDPRILVVGPLAARTAPLRPEVAPADAWIAALEQLTARMPEAVLPDRGKPGDRSMLDQALQAVRAFETSTP